MPNTFSSFKDSKLYSKKEWIYTDQFIFFMTFITPFIFIFLLYDMLRSLNGIKKYKSYIFIIIVVVSYLISDLITSIIHCYHIDQSYSEKQYDIKDGYIVIETTNGYASCHHIFPSNWKDISDLTIFVTAFSFFSIPIFLMYYFLKNHYVKLFLYSTIIFVTFAAFTHKYAHEKLHNRHVPFVIDLLQQMNLSLSPQIHQKHHVENNYNWSLLNGTSDTIFNNIIRNICYFFRKCPIEESVDNVKQFINKNKTNIVNVLFTGDIEGTIQCRLENNIFVKV